MFEDCTRLYDIIITIIDSECGLIHRSPRGIIKAENFSSNDAGHSECENFIDVDLERSISITVEEISLAPMICSNDALTFYDYVNGTYEESRMMCGSDLPKLFQSKTNKMKIHFKSDSGNSGIFKGFQLNYKESDLKGK